MRPVHTVTSFHHQPEAQHPKFFSYQQAAGRLPHLLGLKRTWPKRATMLNRRYLRVGLRCCARAATGHAAAPPNTPRNSRRLMIPPKALGRGKVTVWRSVPEGPMSALGQKRTRRSLFPRKQTFVGCTRTRHRTAVPLTVMALNQPCMGRLHRRGCRYRLLL